LATSRLSLNSPDLIDVAAVMEAFEEMNKCAVTLLLRVERPNGIAKLAMIASALSTNEDVPDPTYLASVSADLSPASHKTMEGAILWALYQLDWRLAEMELGRIRKTA